MADDKTTYNIKNLIDQYIIPAMIEVSQSVSKVVDMLQGDTSSDSEDLIKHLETVLDAVDAESQGQVVGFFQNYATQAASIEDIQTFIDYQIIKPVEMYVQSKVVSGYEIEERSKSKFVLLMTGVNKSWAKNIQNKQSLGSVIEKMKENGLYEAEFDYDKSSEELRLIIEVI